MLWLLEHNTPPLIIISMIKNCCTGKKVSRYRGLRWRESRARCKSLRTHSPRAAAAPCTESCGEKREKERTWALWFDTLFDCLNGASHMLCLNFGRRAGVFFREIGFIKNRFPKKNEKKMGSCPVVPCLLRRAIRSCTDYVCWTRFHLFFLSVCYRI